jgi:hypothetical protein
MTEPLIRMACERLEVDEVTLAHRLGVSLGCLRRWRKGAPPDARLALSALIAGLDPEVISRLGDLRRTDVTPEIASGARTSS